jgi:chromosome segregation ATPase
MAGGTVSARTRFQELSLTAQRRLVLGGLAGVLALIALLTLGQAGRVRSNMIDDATASASAAVEAALVPELTAADARTPATGDRYAALALASEQILADGTVDAVTIWAADGTVLFADDVSLVGDQVRAMRTTVLGVVGDEARSGVVRGFVRSFVPVELAPGVSVAVEVDRGAGPIASATDPWHLMALLAGAAAAFLGLLLARTFTRAGRRAEGFDEETLRAALIGRRKAERALGDAVDKGRALESELERTRQALRETEERAREAARAADDSPRLREHLTLTAEDLKRVEQERDALRERLHETGRAVEAEAARGHEELAGALAEIERLEGVKISLQDRAAKAEDAVAHLTMQVADLQARPDIEAELTSVRKHAEATQRELAETRRRAEAAERRNAELEDVADGLRTRVNDLERRPDLSAKLDAASAALDIAREQIRALTTRTGEADAEAARLRTELEEIRAAGTKELEDARTDLAKTRDELGTATRELKTVEGENEALRDEVEALRREADAAGQLAAGARAELLQTTEHVKALKARAKDAEAELDRERAAMASELEQQRSQAEARLEQERAAAAAEAADRVRAERAEALRAATAEADALRAELGRALEERDAAVVGCDAAVAERRAAAVERDALVAERDALVAERDEAVRARKKAATKRDAVIAERDALAAERDAVTVERDALAGEVEDLRRLRGERDATASALDAARAEVDALRAEAERLRTGLEAAEAGALERERALEEASTDLVRERAALEEAAEERDRLAARLAELEGDAARARADAVALEETGRRELERTRGEAEDLAARVAAALVERDAARAEGDKALAEAEELAAELERRREEQADAEVRLADVQRRLAEVGLRLADADREREDAQAAVTEATARAERAEELLAEAEARFHRTRFTEALGAETAIGISRSDGLAVEIRPDATATPPGVAVPQVNGAPAHGLRSAKVEVDTLVRRVVQESWSDRGRMVSVYAEPVTVEAPADAIETIVGSLLERSIARTSEGNRIVVHVERTEDGASISVEDGRPPDDDAAMAETNRIASELGGWARVEEHMGGGSISRVHLPRSADAGAPALG